MITPKNEIADRCRYCGAKGSSSSLNCHYHKNLAHFFMDQQTPSFLFGAFTLVLSSLILGQWWYLVVWVGEMLLNFGLFETKYLCSHCPFYGEEGKKLRCLGLDGWPKLWKYSPRPMKWYEKTDLILNLTSIIGVPLAGAIHAEIVLVGQNADAITQAAILGLGIVATIAFFQFLGVMRFDYCAKCVNFSCPLNTVAKEQVDAFLRKNPEMLAAWKKAGYSLHPEPSQNE